MTVMADTRPLTVSVVHRPRLLVVTLSLVVLTVSILQTAVVPVLDVIGRQLNASADAVSWVVTANLLAAAAGTPLIGRLADLRNKKHVLLAVLALVLAGSLLAATTASIPLLLLARVLPTTACSGSALHSPRRWSSSAPRRFRAGSAGIAPRWTGSAGSASLSDCRHCC